MFRLWLLYEMIITEVGNGLGNAMFIYAAAKTLAEHHKTELKIDISYLDSWPRRNSGGDWNYGLGMLNISSGLATKEEVSGFLWKTKFRHLNKIFRIYRLFEKKVYDTLVYGYPEKMSDLPNNIYLRGYFGEERFFEPIKDMIKKEFTLKDEYKRGILGDIDEVAGCESVSIHVRRGDLIKLKARVLPIGYYKKAVNVIKEKVKNPKFYLFSDDIEWCKRNFGWLDNINFTNGKSAHEDFEIMQNCKHNILANSALSWWIGYLNDNPEKIVIAPNVFSQYPGKNLDLSKKIDSNVPSCCIQI